MSEKSSPILTAILLAIDLAGTVDDLAAWWAEHKPALRRLEAAELAQAIAAKDARKATLAPPPSDSPATPPAAILPPRRLPPWPGPRLL